MDQEKEDLIYELKKKLQALEWDIKYNRLPSERVEYYNVLLEKYNKLKDNSEEGTEENIGNL